jgi:hypothetical protein
MKTVTASHPDARSSRPFDVTNAVLGSAILGFVAGQLVFCLAFGVAPAGALSRPMWTALVLGGLGLAVAVKEHGSARFAFLAWAFHQVLIALTFVGHRGWAPWTIRSSILALVAGLLVASAWPLSVRNRRFVVLVLILTIAFTVSTKWAGSSMLRDVQNWSGHTPKDRLTAAAPDGRSSWSMQDSATGEAIGRSRGRR